MISYRSVMVLGFGAALAATTALAPAAALAQDGGEPGGSRCDVLDSLLERSVYTTLQAALRAVAPNKELNGGLGNHMWGAIVDDRGVVCAIAFTSERDLNDQWLGSRVIAAQKANTAVLFNLNGGVGGTVDALSTANLYGPTQPGGSLFGLQFSNPVDPAVAYGDNVPGGDETSQGADTTDIPAYGLSGDRTPPEDPLVGKYVGGINVFGGGLGLYDAEGTLVGGLGVSGDTSCADHNIAWRVRHELGLDQLTTAEVRGLTAAPFQDDIIYSEDAEITGFEHPLCGFGEENADLPPTE